MNCPHGEEVSMLHDGALAPQEVNAVEAHIATCQECSAFLRDLRSISLILASEKPSAVASWSSVVDRARRRTHSRRRVAVVTSIAAVVLIAVLGVIVPRLDRDTPPTPQAGSESSVFVHYDGGGRAVIYVRKGEGGRR